MYCIKCGVELADSEDRCPLCGTKVILPEGYQVKNFPDPSGGQAYELYPPYEEEAPKNLRIWIMLSVSILYTILIATFFIIDLHINHKIIWAGYAAGGMMVFYIMVLLPLWFKHPNPVIFVPCSIASAILFCGYICWKTGGNWFLTFALPVGGCTMVIASAFTTLMCYVRKGWPYITGGALILCSGLTVLIERLINITFHTKFIFWSFYPLLAGILVGMFFIFIGICRPFRQWLHKKLFI